MAGKQQACTSCNQVRHIDAAHGMCKRCAVVSLDIPDSDSPCTLDETGWFNDGGIMRYLGGAA